MKRFYTLLAIAIGSALLTTTGQAQVPTSRQIPFSGVQTTIAPGTPAQTLTLRVLNDAAPPVARYCETQTLDVDANGAISFSLGAGGPVDPPCNSAPPGLNPDDFASGSTRSLDIVDTTGVSVLPNPPGPIALKAVAFALSPGPQGPQGIQGPQGVQGPPGAQGPPGVVQTVSAGDASIAVGGTAADRFVSVAPNGVTNAHVASGALSPAKIAGNAATLGSNSFVGNQNVSGGTVTVSNSNGVALDGIGSTVGVRGSAGANGFAIVGSAPANGTAGQFNGSVNVTGPLSAGANLRVVGDQGINGNLRVEGGVSASSAGLFDVDAPFVPGGRLRVAVNGNVGIGTTSPARKLDVVGDASVSGTLSAGVLDIGLEYVSQTSNVILPGVSDNVTVTCPTGKLALGAAIGVDVGGPSYTVFTSGPLGAPLGSQWRVNVRNDGIPLPLPLTIKVTATCARVK